MMLGAHPMWMSKRSADIPPAEFSLAFNTGGGGNGLYTVLHDGSTYCALTYYSTPRLYIGSDPASLTYTSAAAIGGLMSTVFKGDFYFITSDANVTKVTPAGVSSVVASGSYRSMTSDNNNLYVFGLGGSASFTSDGSSFSSMTTGTTDDITGKSYVIDGKVCAATGTSKILYSSDSGSSFNLSNISPDVVSFLGQSDGTSMYLISNLGSSNPAYIYKTSNGTSVSRLYLPSSPSAQKANSIGVRYGELYVVARQSSPGVTRLYKSSNQGASFNQLPLPFSGSNNAVIASANDTLFISDLATGNVYVSD